MTNWITVTGFDVVRVLNVQVMNKSNQNTDADAISNPTEPQIYDPSTDNRADDLVQFVIQQFRGAIQVAGKYPLSVTPAAVPPEMAKHVLNMAAWELVCSTPNLQMVVMSEKGAFAPFQTFYKEAVEYLKKIEKGQNIVLPTDPTGQDLINAVDNNRCLPDGTMNQAYNPAIQSVRVGASSCPTDMNTDQSIFFGGGCYAPCFPVNQLGQP